MDYGLVAAAVPSCRDPSRPGGGARRPRSGFLCPICPYPEFPALQFPQAPKNPTEEWHSCLAR